MKIEDAGSSSPALDRLRELIAKWQEEGTDLSDQHAGQLEKAVRELVPDPPQPVDLTNHHNAVTCPHCNPQRLMFVRDAVALEWAAARAYLQVPDDRDLVDAIGRAVIRAREKGIASTRACLTCGGLPPGQCSSAADLCSCEAEPVGAVPPAPSGAPAWNALPFWQLERAAIRTGCETDDNRRADFELKRRGYVFDAPTACWVAAPAPSAPQPEKEP